MDVLLSRSSVLDRITTYQRLFAQLASHHRICAGGESLEVERDRITLEGVMCYYRTLDPKLIEIILRDIGKGFYPTNDQGIAITGAKATFDSLGPMREDPASWKGLEGLLIFEPAV